MTRYRRTNQELEGLHVRLYAYAQEHYPVTVRQLFYAMTVQGMAPKTEAGYALVGRELTKMREAGHFPFSWIVDNTRRTLKPQTYANRGEMMQRMAQTYRLALWERMPARVEIWLEKDALSGVLWEVTQEYDVSLYPTRGYPSLTFLHTAAETITYIGKPTYIYYMGDHDPSGVDIPRKIHATLKRYAPDAQIHFQRIGVNLDQIEAWKLPSRPTKKTDSRAKSFEGESVELDAIPPQQLRALCREAIEQHIDRRELARLKEQEQNEREDLQYLADVLGGVAS